MKRTRSFRVRAAVSRASDPRGRILEAESSMPFSAETAWGRAGEEFESIAVMGDGSVKVDGEYLEHRDLERLADHLPWQ